EVRSVSSSHQRSADEWRGVDRTRIFARAGEDRGVGGGGLPGDGEADGPGGTANLERLRVEVGVPNEGVIFDDAASDEVLLDDAFQHFGSAGVIPGAFRVNDGDGAAYADA